MPDDADRQLSTFVNNLGIIIFTMLVAYHFITATSADASGK